MNAYSTTKRACDDISTLKTENASLRKEIDGRPTKTEVRYGIATVGVSGCGKTALTLRWANPRVRPEQVKATQFSKYQRTISRVYDPDSRIHVEHIFEVYDWGGEHIEEALTALVKLGTIHALLVVVDLGPVCSCARTGTSSARSISIGSLREFDQQVLRFFCAGRGAELQALRAVYQQVRSALGISRRNRGEGTSIIVVLPTIWRVTASSAG